MGNQYLEELAKAVAKTPIPEFSSGASGYFSKPQSHFDPEIFAGEYVRSEVREHIINTLFRFWTQRGYKSPGVWTTVWLAGSGVSYQWAGDRGNGDLDVLMGIDWPKFYQYNPQWAFTPIEPTTDHLDNELRSLLWPRTAHTEFGGKTFEVTYFVNQDATDIRDIHPYAAYNLTYDTWTIRPPKHTAYEDDPGTPAWRSYAEQDLITAQEIRWCIERVLSEFPPAGSPQWVNAATAISRQVDYAVRLMTDIHGHRRQAFRNGGKGYWDYHNWRWQMAKKNGIVSVLGAIEHIHTTATAAFQKKLYGAPLATADELTIRAALSHVDGR